MVSSTYSGCTNIDFQFHAVPGSTVRQWWQQQVEPANKTRISAVPGPGPQFPPVRGSQGTVHTQETTKAATVVLVILLSGTSQTSFFMATFFSKQSKACPTQN